MVNTEYPCYNISVFEDYLKYKYLIDCCGKVIVSAMTFSLYFAFKRYEDVIKTRKAVFGMADMYCPKCKTLLNNDEKASGKCFNCGATFSSSLPEPKKETSTYNDENTIGGILKAIGILILIIGTIGSFIIAGGDGHRYEFSLFRFIVPEIATTVSGMMFLGFSEIIRLLQDIKNKLK